MVQPSMTHGNSDNPLDSYAKTSSMGYSRITAAITFDFAAIRYLNEEYGHC